MSDLRFVFTAADGSVTVVTPAAPRVEGESDAELIARVASRMQEAGSMPRDAAYSIVSKDDLPTDRSYRNAWTFDGKNFGHDMARARDIHRDKIRAFRAPLMADLDTQFIRALEAGAETKAVVAEKQRLRDAPADPRIEAAGTVADLKAAWPL